MVPARVGPFADKRVCIVYDDRARPETTGSYVLRAAAGLCLAEHRLPDQLDDLDGDEFDLWLNVDDGYNYVLPPRLRPAAWWCIDTHLQYDWDLYKGTQFDWVFAAQKIGAEHLRLDGLEHVEWLPLACDPAIHGKHDVPKEHDVCFVGNLFEGPRLDLIRLLSARFPDTLVTRAYFTEMARIFSGARIVFNRSIGDDVNMRVFEGVCAGSLLVTNALPPESGQEELFRDGEHLVLYRTADELIERVDHYLRHDEERERIAGTGRLEALSRHTYAHRVEHILARCFGSAGRDDTVGLTSAIVGSVRGEPYLSVALEGLRRGAREPCETVVAPAGDGLAAWRAGIAHARGDYMLLTDDGVVMLPESFDRMIHVLRRDAAAAMVVPVSTLDLDPALRNASLVALEGVAAEMRRVQAGLAVAVRRMRPDAVLVRRTALAGLGPLDGASPDDALERWRRRAVELGRTCVGATDALVHRLAPAQPISADVPTLTGSPRVLRWERGRQTVAGRSNDEAKEATSAGRDALVRGELSAARAALRRALDLSPQDAESHYLLGVTLLEQGHVVEAVASLELATRLDPGSSDFANGLGEALKALGDVTGARAFYQRALVLDPRNDEAASNLAALEDGGR